MDRMSSAPTADEIARDARWLAQALDPMAGSVRLIAMDRAAYRAASFLDDRMLQQPVNSQVIPWPLIEEAITEDLRRDARWIFHIGHVGSTLVSRLLGEIDGVLAIREPRILRDLAMSPPEIRARYLAPIPPLMSRTFATDETACVKATSFAGEIAAELVPPGERALFVYASPRNYIASILAGENSLVELRTLASSREQRMAGRVGVIAPCNDAELAAAAWACEMTALEAASETMNEHHVGWVDFDGMLGDMTAALTEVAEIFGFNAEPEQIGAIARGPLMTRYSKALQYDYSPSLRRELIDQAIAEHGREIDGALAMLRAASEKSPLLERALIHSEGD
jgi:hypothetical protein